MTDNSQTTIAVNDFDSLRQRVYQQIMGHRTDYCLAVLYSVLKDVEAMHLKNWGVVIEKETRA